MMKKALYLIILTVVIGIAQLYGSPYYLFMSVYNADGTSGTAATANSFAGVSAYRIGIANEIGHQESGPNPTYLNEIYPADGVGTPAYLYSDVGSSDWAATSVAV